MSHYLLLLVIWAAVMNITLGLELHLTEHEMKTTKGKFCGTYLSDMLSMICNGVYNSKQKRNLYRTDLNGHDDYQDSEPLEYSDDQVMPFPFRSKQRARAIIPTEFRKRSSHGVATECCHKACSLWEMTGYCGDQ